MRRSDLMPIAAVGNTQKMLGISLEEVRNELASRHVIDKKVKQEKMT